MLAFRPVSAVKALITSRASFHGMYRDHMFCGVLQPITSVRLFKLIC